MIQQGGKYYIARDALEILPFLDEPQSEWMVSEILEDTIIIQRILADNQLEDLAYEVTEQMLVVIEPNAQQPEP